MRTLIRWAGDDPPPREGLRATLGRVVRAYEEWFAGYRDDPRALLARTFEEVGGYADMVPDVAMVTKRLLGDFNADPLRGDLMAATGL